MKGKIISSSFSRDSGGAFYVVQVKVPVEYGPTEHPPKKDPAQKGVVLASTRDYPDPPEGEVEILPAEKKPAGKKEKDES